MAYWIFRSGRVRAFTRGCNLRRVFAQVRVDCLIDVLISSLARYDWFRLHRPAPRLAAFALRRQAQNLREPPIERPRPYGVRVSLPAEDPFRKLLGDHWHVVHWYAGAQERDAALADLSRRHEYSRQGDRPSLVFDKLERLAESRLR